MALRAEASFWIKLSPIMALAPYPFSYIGNIDNPILVFLLGGLMGDHS